MKRPKNRNARIDSRRLRSWVTTFAGYRHTVSEDRIRDWMIQFQQQHRDIAARILDCIDFFSDDQIAGAFRSVLRGFEDWHDDENKRNGRWRFVAYSASAGESGDSMLHKFRHANGLAGRQNDKLFIYRSEILGERLGYDDTVVLIDDLVASNMDYVRFRTIAKSPPISWAHSEPVKDVKY